MKPFGFFVAAVAVVLSVVPFGLPPDAALARTIATGFALAIPIKLLYLRAGRRHPSMAATSLLRVVWLLVPTDTAFAATRSDRSDVRQLGLRRLGRTALKVALLVTIVLGKPALASLGPLLTFANAFQIYFMISSVADLVTGTVGLFGVLARDAFDAPYLSVSPSEFWARRWNTFVSEFLARYIFRPCARRRRPLLGVYLAFLFSGLAHEYFVVATVGADRYRMFFMLAFFLLHGAAVMLPTALPRLGRLGARWPRHIAIILHIVWLMATVPLFIEPMKPVLDSFDHTVRGLLATVFTLPFTTP